MLGRDRPEGSRVFGSGQRGGPRSGRSAPSAGAGVPRAYLEPPAKCAIFNAQNCAIFDAH